MKYLICSLAVIIITALSFCGYAQSIDPLPIDSSGLTFQSIMEQVYQNIDSTDTAEGKSFRTVKRIETFWTPRVVANPTDTSQPNMFQSYFHSLQKSVYARQAAATTCNSTGFHGNWECIGPDSLDGQNMGYVTSVWADPADSNYVLAGTYGGLFKTTDGGLNWTCITNNAPIAYGIHHISCIAVNPLNKNTIYLGTASDMGLYGYSILKPHYNWGSLGSAMLRSYDGGQNWEIETLGIHGNFRDSNAMIQQVYFTPDSSRLYALGENDAYTRLNNSSAAWFKITPDEVTQNKSNLTDLEFDPDDQSHFFIASGYLADKDPKAGIWESTVPVPGPTQWTKITAGFSDTLSFFSISSTAPKEPFSDTELIQIDISIPDGDTLYALVMSNARLGNISPFTGLYKFNMNGTTRSWTRVSNQIPFVQNPNYSILKLEVSPANTSANGNMRNIYIGSDVPYQSYDGGQTFQQIGEYHYPTHADTRDIFIQAATNTERGLGDRIFFANDGGVSFRPSGYDTSRFNNVPNLTTKNINGKGLTCGHFWSVATSEYGGIGLTGSMHNGFFSYEPTKVPIWKRHLSVDAYTTFFDEDDKTLAYGIYGFGSLTKDSSVSGSNREINLLTGSKDNFDSVKGGRFFNPQFKVDDSNYHYVGASKLYIEKISDGLWDEFTPSTNLPTGVNANVHDLAISPGGSSFTGYILMGYRREIHFRNPILPSSDFSPTASLPNSSPLSCITTDPVDPSRVWVGMGSFNDPAPGPTVDRVYYSPDWGTTWIDVSKGLPTVIVSEIIYYEGQNTLFCATDVGVYKCDFSTYDSSATSSGYNASVEWECFNDGATGSPDFPNVYVTQLSINHCQGKLYASTYGRSIWATNMFDDDYNPSPTEVITTNTTWNADKYINTGVRVTNGATLTIENNGGVLTTIYMPKHGEIIVEPGAKLIVDGATITNGCEDCMWNGIRAVGNPSQSQTAALQGSVELTDATIEHARIGIANYSSDGFAFQSTGGMIEAENTTFLNNARAIELEPYKYKTSFGVSLLNYKATFTECVFEINDSYKGGIIDSFRSHVAIREIRGASFNGCQFYNRYTGSEYAGMGDGIRASNSKLYIRAYCTNPAVSPCPSYLKTTFIGLRTGIWLFGDGVETNTASLVDRCIFDSCAVGIHLLSGENTIITRNSFTMGNGSHINLHPVWDCYKSIGLWTDGTESFIAEDNDFIGVTHGGQQAGHQNFGTLTDDSYKHNVSTTIYNNSFDGLDYACLARGVNSNSQPRGPIMPSSDAYGLLYECNTYDNNDTDIIIGYLDQPSGTTISICDYQGSLTESAGNLFLETASTSHLLNIPKTTWITYYHYGGTTEPNINSSYPFTKMTANAAAGCTSRYPETGGTNNIPYSSGALGTAKNNFFTYRDLKQTEQADLQTLIDGGDTEGLLDDIANWTQSDSTTVKTTLLGHSPYLSTDVAMAVADANLLFQSSLIEILEENPEILKYEGMLEHLQYNIPNPLNGTQIDDLRTVSETPSERSEYESNIMSYTAKMSWYGNQALSYYLLDTSATFIDSIPAWLDTLNTLSAAYTKVAHYSGIGDYTTAASILSDIPNNFTMSDDEQNYYSLYNDLWDLLEGIRDDDRDILSMTSTEYDELIAIGEDTYAAGKGIDNTVKGIRDQIDQGYGLPCDFNPIAIPNPKPGKSQNNTNSNQINNRHFNKLISQNDFVIAYPNPANEQVTFEYEYQNVRNGLSITVTNSTGQVIKTINLRSYKGKTQWITDSVPSGVYIYELRDGESKIDVGRIVITK